jgi:hypothetical protein
MIDQNDIEIIRQIIREEVSNINAIDRLTFQKNIQITDGKNIKLGEGNGTKIGDKDAALNGATGIGPKLGLFNTTPVVQFPWSVGNNIGAVGTVSLGSGNAIKDDSSFAGTSVGTNQYTIGDIVTALKKLGILAQTS